MRKLGLKSQKEWLKYCRSGEKPVDIPQSPWNVYPDDWIDPCLIGLEEAKLVAIPKLTDHSKTPALSRAVLESKLSKDGLLIVSPVKSLMISQNGPRDRMPKTGSIGPTGSPVIKFKPVENGGHSKKRAPSCVVSDLNPIRSGEHTFVLEGSPMIFRPIRRGPTEKTG